MPDGTSSLIAVFGFSLALLGFVTMAGIPVALGVSPPNEFWLLGTSIAGVLTGILVPPTRAKQDEQDRRAAIAQLPPQEQLVHLDAPAANAAPAANPAPAANAAPARTALSSITPSDWRLTILGGLFVVCGGIGLWFLNAPYEGSTQLFAVAGATGATALGILVPSPKLKSSG
jgi:hypothetical protein